MALLIARVTTLRSNSELSVSISSSSQIHFLATKLQGNMPSLKFICVVSKKFTERGQVLVCILQDFVMKTLYISRNKISEHSKFEMEGH